MTAIKGGTALRSKTVAGKGTPPDQLQIGMPFLLEAPPLDPTKAQRWVCTSPITHIARVTDNLGHTIFITTHNSIYELEYLEGGE